MTSSGYDPRRQRWSDEAMGRFFPEVLDAIGYRPHSIEFATGRLHALDTDCGVDAIVRAHDRSSSWALRLRGCNYHHFQDVSIRFMSLQTPGKGLEANKTIAQLLLYGWADTRCEPPYTPPARLLEWHVVSLKEMLDAWQAGTLEAQERPNRDPSSTGLYFAVGDLYRLNLIRHSSASGRPPATEPAAAFGLSSVAPDADDTRRGLADKAKRALNAELAGYRQERLI